jgi:hypothetical protein
MNKSNIREVSFVNSGRRINKRGQMGEGVFLIYRLLIITVIAFVIFGISSVFYNHEIDIRDAEAVLLAREISDCLSPNGVLDLDGISSYGELFSYCGFPESERFYVGVDVYTGSEKVGRLYQGDSGSLWIKELFGGDVDDLGTMGKYKPGYFEFEYSSFVLKDGAKVLGNVKVEVLVNYDE